MTEKEFTFEGGKFYVYFVRRKYPCYLRRKVKYLVRAKWRSWQAPARHVVKTDTYFFLFTVRCLFWRIFNKLGELALLAGWEHVSLFYKWQKVGHVSVGLDFWEFDTWMLSAVFYAGNIYTYISILALWDHRRRFCSCAQVGVSLSLRCRLEFFFFF